MLTAQDWLVVAGPPLGALVGSGVTYITTLRRLGQERADRDLDANARVRRKWIDDRMDLTHQLASNLRRLEARYDAMQGALNARISALQDELDEVKQEALETRGLLMETEAKLAVYATELELWKRKPAPASSAA